MSVRVSYMECCISLSIHIQQLIPSQGPQHHSLPYAVALGNDHDLTLFRL